MAVSLVGTVCNACDAITGFNAGNISGDDPFVQGSACIGLKATGSAVNELYTTTITSGPYNFSSGGGQFGYHIIVWLNSKSPIAATLGFQVVVGNGTSRGRWYVQPANYTGGFVPRVINTAAAFDIIAAGSWTTGGNPGQLSSVTQVGGAVEPTVSIMGSFNNIGIDQFTIGLGVRVDGGTSGTPNTFETVRAADQDTNIWGWWRATNGSYVGRGKLYIGPASGSATSVFTDSSFSTTFADERVAVGFYEINTRGAGTSVDWSIGNISAANPTNARWSLTVQSDTLSFSDTAGVWRGADVISLNSASTLTGTSLIDCSRLTQNGATLSGCTIINANTTTSSAFILSDNPGLISDSFFTFSSGHAIEIAPTGAGPFSFNLSNCQFSGYAASDGSTGNETIYINPATSSANITLNIVDGGSTPSIRLASGYTGTFTLVVSPVTLTITAKDITTLSTISSARVLVLADAGGSLPSQATVTITRSGTTATVSHTSHGLVTGNVVQIKGANQQEYNGIYTITFINSNSYSYTVSGTPATPATGTIKSTAVIINTTTDGSGVATDTRSYSTDQPITGRIRHATSGTLYKTAPIAGTISSTAGLNLTVQMIPDQ